MKRRTLIFQPRHWSSWSRSGAVACLDIIGVLEAGGGNTSQDITA
ncbi:MAG TPA: hypothetical protein VKP30_16290 [Polyangiaceae bacterium]|nr:hypothetical protein [Polyangiaceae bacterium]